MEKEQLKYDISQLRIDVQDLDNNKRMLRQEIMDHSRRSLIYVLMCLSLFIYLFVCLLFCCHFVVVCECFISSYSSPLFFRFPKSVQFISALLNLMSFGSRHDDLQLKIRDLEALVSSEKALRLKAEQRSTSMLTKLQDETQQYVSFISCETDATLSSLLTVRLVEWCE